ncbi:MAG: TrbI/VirB10 family protein [Sphingomicrobium sp.]
MTDLLLVKRPQVAGLPRKTPLAVVVLTLSLIGIAVFLWLSSARAAQQDGEAMLPPLATSTATEPQASAPTAVQPAASSAPAPLLIPNSGPVTLVPTSPVPLPSGYAAPVVPFIAPPPIDDGSRSPSLVVDLAQADPQRAPGAVLVRGDSRFDGRAVPGEAPLAGPANDRNLSDTERFSARVGGEEVEIAQARRMTGLDRLVPQGAIIGAVMETALNSDLPGFARAITSRDVRSFDGSTVLIPAGSRVIGQYKSGIAQGASRVFVLWTRLIRPDGVSIELASPAVDELGRGGIGGKVNRHFLQRFGGAILTSVLSGGISAAAASLSGGSTVIVGSASQATGLASQATQSSEIPPTITTRQGATVRIFVARDLDFSRVGPAQ